MKLLRLFAAIFSLSLRREAAFRANLLFQLFVAAATLASGLVTLQVVYTQTETLGGWAVGEAIALLGVYGIMSGFLATFVEPNLQWFAGQVRDGKLDDILLKPVSSVFLVSLGSCAPLALSQVVLGLLTLGLGLREGDFVLTAGGIAAATVLLAVGFLLTWASRTLLAIIALWAPAFEMDVVYGALWQFGRYPVTVYRQPIRWVLTYLLPVAFVATVPTRALLHGASPALLLGGVLAGAGAVLAVLLLWRAGLRHYTSATS